MNTTTTQLQPQLRQLKTKIEKVDGLEVKRTQSESSYPTDSLVVYRKRYSGTVPKEIQDLVIERELEIVDVDSNNRLLWVIPYRGKDWESYHSEDLPQELHGLIDSITDSQAEVKAVAEEIKRCAEYLQEMEGEDR